MSLLSGGEPRGLPGAVCKAVRFQQAVADHPLDDLVIDAINFDGTPATLELQAKRSLDFTASDTEYGDVVHRLWAASQKSEFQTTRYELAVAIARTSTRIEREYQEVLHWARQLPDAQTFIANIEREGFSSRGKRDFVAAFLVKLQQVGAASDDETVWRLLRRFQVLVFDFESIGSDYLHRAREGCRLLLPVEEPASASHLWSVLCAEAMAKATAAGTFDRPGLAKVLSQKHGIKLATASDYRKALSWLKSAASYTLDGIRTSIGGATLQRSDVLEQALSALDEARVLRIEGAPGVGKSAVLKELASQIAAESSILVVDPARIVPGGWPQMAHTMGCQNSREDFFNEVGRSGGAVLFIDNIDQIEDPQQWATVTDLLVGVARNKGWRAVVTGPSDSTSWIERLPAEVRQASLAKLMVRELSDNEASELSRANPQLSLLLDAGHPAKKVARNLFYLSRMIDIGVGTESSQQPIASETDLAHHWWRFGGGRTEAGKLTRLKVLRAIASQTIADPTRLTFKTDEFESSTIEELLRLDSLREDRPGATVAFRHDVLRDWAIGFLFLEEPGSIAALPIDLQIPASLARGLEMAARLAVEQDASGNQWIELLAAVSRKGAHGSWRRPILLALTRAEASLVLLDKLEPKLLENDGQLLAEIIKLTIAVDSEALTQFLARSQMSIPIPSGLEDFTVPKGLSWLWLILYLIARFDKMPFALIPDMATLFRNWLIGTGTQLLPINSRIVEILFGWTNRADRALRPVMVRHISELEDPDFHFPHMRAVRDDIRMTAFAFSHLNPAAAQSYIAGLDADDIRHHGLHDIICAQGIAKSAPRELADLTLAGLIEEEDPEDRYGSYRSSRDRFGPFGALEVQFSPASPGQGPFFELLDHSSADGLRVVRGVVEHATAWRRELYREDRASFPSLTIAFAGTPWTFHGDMTVYTWPRISVPSSITSSALMALEAWGHKQIEGGRPFEDVLWDVLGPDGGSVALLSVAVDLALSHWDVAKDAVWPFLASPELLRKDWVRHIRDISGVDNDLLFQQEASTWRVKKADLEHRVSRRLALMEGFIRYVLEPDGRILTQLKPVLQEAVEQNAKLPADGDPIDGLQAIGKRALRMCARENWAEKKVVDQNGREIDAYQYQPDADELRERNAKDAEVVAEIQDTNVKATIQLAFADPAKSSADIVAQAIAWAKEQPAEPTEESDDEESDFERGWRKRSIVMAAAIAARDYRGADQKEVLDWAASVLYAAATRAKDGFRAGPSIQFDEQAIAAVGLIDLYQRTRDRADLERIFRLAAARTPAVQNAIGEGIAKLSGINDRLARSLTRIVMEAVIRPHWAYEDDETEELEKAYEVRVANRIAIELAWLGSSADEPEWPVLPDWLSRPRRSIRIGAARTSDALNDDDVGVPEFYVDEHTLGAWFSHLIPLTFNGAPEWLGNLARQLMKWTAAANGPQGRDTGDRDGRPDTWNPHFMDFVGILSVALPHDQVAQSFLTPMLGLPDNSFCDLAGPFLRGFDRATVATNTLKSDNPRAIRAPLIERVRRSRAFRRLSEEKSNSAETHIGDTLNALFYQPSRFANFGRPHVPDDWTGLADTLPALADLVAAAPASGYVATLFLNLIQRFPDPTFIRPVLVAFGAWRDAYGIDANFWSENEAGRRICAWLKSALSKDSSSLQDAEIRHELSKSLDTVIRSGVAQARDLEEFIRQMTSGGTG